MKLLHLFSPVVLLSAAYAAPVAAQDYAYLSSNLFGDYISAGGSDDAEGDFNGEADLTTGRLCYYLEVEGLDDADGIAVHEGGSGDDGPVVLSLTMPSEAGDEVCLTVDTALLGSISEAPANYYLLVRSPAHPGGAIRGQLQD